MHTLLAAIFVLLAAFSTGSCDASKEEGVVRIGVSIPAPTHGWTAGLGWWAERAMEKHPRVEWVYATAATPEQQVNQIETMLTRDLDALVVLATESAPLTPVARKVRQRGVFLFSVDRGFTEPVADVFLEGDNRAYGRKSAQFMVDRLGGEGDIVVLTGIPCTVDTYRVEGAMEVFRKHPGVRILDKQPSDWNREKSLEVMEAFLTRYDHIDAVWAQDDGSALGAAQAIREAGREDEMWIMGGAGMKEVVKRVMDRDPMFPADITYPPAMIAAGIHMTVAQLVHDGNEQAVAELMPQHLGIDKELLRDGTEEPWEGQRYIKLPVHLITPENAERFYFPDAPY